MVTNIDAQLEDILSDLTPYWEEIRRQQSEIIMLMFRDPFRLFRGGMELMRKGRDGQRDILSGRTSPIARVVLAQMLKAPLSDEQRQMREDLAADFSINVIADRIVTKHPDFDFANIKKLHESRRIDRLKLTVRQLFGIALAVIAFVGKSVPDSIVTDLGWTVAQFERWVFYATCVLLGYMGLMIWAEWSAIGRDIEKHEFFARILSYLELSAPKPKAKQARTDIEK